MEGNCSGECREAGRRAECRAGTDLGDGESISAQKEERNMIRDGAGIAKCLSVSVSQLRVSSEPNCISQVSDQQRRELVVFLTSSTKRVRHNGEPYNMKILLHFPKSVLRPAQPPCKVEMKTSSSPSCSSYSSSPSSSQSVELIRMRIPGRLYIDPASTEGQSCPSASAR